MLKVLKKVRYVTFEYSTQEDFEVKVHILKVIAKNHAALKHLETIEFDYVRSMEEMKIIKSINDDLDQNDFIQISIRLMPTTINTENLPTILQKSPKLCKFFLTISDEALFKNDISTMKQNLRKFKSMHSLAFQIETEHIIFDLLNLKDLQ